MSVQSTLNEQAIDLLPKVKSYLSQQSAHYYNQFYETALRLAAHSSVPLTEMTAEQKENFENILLNIFTLRKVEDLNYESSEKESYIGSKLKVNIFNFDKITKIINSKEDDKTKEGA